MVRRIFQMFLDGDSCYIIGKKLEAEGVQSYAGKTLCGEVITELEKLPEAVSEFDDALWGSLVEYVTVAKDKTMVFTLIGGTEMKA